MKYVLIICAGFLLMALADFPIGYYTFLRIAVFIGAISIIIRDYENGMNFWVISFGIIAILFNPFIPIYLNNKDAWMPIDILSALLFLIKSFSLTKFQKNEQF